MEEKKCSHCGKYKPIADFWKNSSSKDGLQNYCKDCVNEIKRMKKAEKNGSVRKKRQSKQIYGNDYRKNADLANFTDKQLLYEIRNRGYHGKLKYEEEIEL